MIPLSASQQHLADLFARLPHVRVDWVRVSPVTGSVRYALSIGDPEVLTRIVHLAMGLNVPVGVVTDRACGTSHHRDPACLRYEVQVPLEEDDDTSILFARELERRFGP